MRLGRLARAALALVLSPGTAAFAAETPSGDAYPKLTLVLNGLAGPVSNTFEETRSVRMFQEDGSITSSYSAKGGIGGDLGLLYRISRRFGVMASVTLAPRDTTDTYQARLPHPLYLNAHRIAEGTLDGLSYSETTGHLSLAFVGDAGAVEYTLFAGPSFYQVEAELIDRADTTETYPFDEVTVALPTIQQKKSAAGIHVGAGLTYPMSARIGLGLQARYGTASLTLAPNDTDETDIKAGGLQIGIGVRIGF